MRLAIFFLIAPTDAVSKLGSSTNFKITTVKSYNKAPGMVYGAFPQASSSGYDMVAVDSKGNVMILDAESGKYVANAYANVIYV